MLIFNIILLNLIFILGFIFLLPVSAGLFAFVTSLIIILAVLQLRRAHQQQDHIIQTIFNGLRNFQDGDFAISLAEKPFLARKAHHQLICLFNQVTDKLRAEKQSLYQRELLLDKVVNASDVVTVLVNHRDTIIFANRAAQLFFAPSAAKPVSLLGQSWLLLLKKQLPELIEHTDQSNGLENSALGNSALESSAIIQLTPDKSTGQINESEQSWHLSRHQLKLHGSRHQLILLKPITKELNKQELKTWKKVIRVINHELNNSIAPISSMCHSGKVLADRINEPQLNRVFNTISGRINKLSEFIQNYSQLARLSSPHKQVFELLSTIEQLQSLYHFTLICQQTSIKITADISQLEQLLINLLKNAGQACADIPSELTITISDGQLTLIIRDFGPGMAPEVMQKAFLPYYSTKPEGSGIGLSICREVIDAHHGKISLNNHPEGGLQVVVQLPLA